VARPQTYTGPGVHNTRPSRRERKSWGPLYPTVKLPNQLRIRTLVSTGDCFAARLVPVMEYRRNVSKPSTLPKRTPLRVVSWRQCGAPYQNTPKEAKAARKRRIRAAHQVRTVSECGAFTSPNPR
jgi:hypothetical protein